MFRPINRHFTSTKSNVSRHTKKLVSSPIENLPNRTSSGRHKIKKLRDKFIQKWTDDARFIYAQNHRITPSSNTYSDQMINVDLEKRNYRRRQKSTHSHQHSLSASSLLNNSSHTSTSSLFQELHNNKIDVQSSNSSIVEKQLNIKQRNRSSNNNAIVCTKPTKSPHDDIECQIS